MALIQNPPDANNNYIGTENDDEFDGASVGPSTYYGLGGDDLFYQFFPGDTIEGGAGLDQVSVALQTGNPTLIVRLDRGYITGDHFGAGRLIVNSVEFVDARGNSDGPVLLIGDDNNNRLESNVLGSFARGELGNDRIALTGNGDFTVLGDNGNDTIVVFSFDGMQGNYVSGGAGDDVITSGTRVNGSKLFGNDGNDTIGSSNAPDLLFGGPGDDTLTGGLGNDRLFGDDGADTIDGGGGDDIIKTGGGHGDVANGGDGNDRIFGDGETSTMNGDAGRDTIIGGAGFETLNGGDDIDRLYGNDGIDTLDGGAGNDLLNAGAGDDFVRASGGADRVWLGSGADQVLMAGQTNGDQFKIFDFDTAVDVIRLDLAGVPNFQTVEDRLVDRGQGGSILNLSDFNMGIIVFENLFKAALSADDFGF